MNTPHEFTPLLTGIRRLEASGFAGGAALATLTRTRGSTFRRPGARMLVCGDGTVVRGLSGGCPEADIVARAARVIAADSPEIARYNANNVFDPMIETGCGGDIEVLIEPLNCVADLRFLTAVEHCIGARESGFLATAYARNGRCLAPRPRRLVWRGGIADDDLGDRLLTKTIIERVATSDDRQPAVTRIEADTGAVDVLIEQLRPPHMLVLIGVSAVSLALARLAVQLGWIATVVDHREGVAESDALPDRVRLLNLQPEALRSAVAFDRHSSAVVMTHKLDTDIAYLQVLRDVPVAYLGAIGSRTRAAKLYEATGLAPPRLRAPAGLDVGSETPEEIALAIAAEIVAVSTGHGGGALSAIGSPIH